MIADDALGQWLLAFADDEHLMGQQHTEWIGVAPFLEEDMAFSSIGQDELGHAALLYEYLLRRENPDLDGAALDAAIDDLALRREPTDYRSCALVELPCDDWAAALVRHWLYDRAEALRWTCLADAAVDDDLIAISARARREESFHLRHADALLDALLGDPDAATRLVAALAAVLPVARSLFDSDPSAGELATAFAAARPAWEAAVVTRFGAGADPRADSRTGSGRTERSAHFAALYGRMREVIDIDPDARW